MRCRAISRFVWVLGLCLPGLLAGVELGVADETPPIGFEALLGFDKLPLLVDWPAFQDSSYHRDDINQDAGNFIRVEPNGDQVLTDVDGPGVVYRLWSAGVVGRQMSDDCRLRFYFDHEETPRIDLSWRDRYSCTLKLKQGWNKVLVKCVNHFGGWGFALRPGDPDGELKFARQPE